MARQDPAAVRLSPAERLELAELAARLERTQSDVIRLALRRLALEVKTDEPKETTPCPSAT